MFDANEINESSYFTILTWNIEGLSRNYQNLRLFSEQYSPKLIFLSEPMCHQSDLPPLLLPFRGTYECHLNSEDLQVQELSLSKSKAHGGTMVLWHSSISSSITVIPSESPSFQSVLMKIPGTVPSVHTALYLPTSGKEDQFMSSLVDLGDHIEQIRLKYPDAPHFLRGDANCNQNNIARHGLFSHFCAQYQLQTLPLLHPTYHHFVGDGCFDSEIDVILSYSPHGNASEHLEKIVCKLDSPFINSQHDVIISTCKLPKAPLIPPDKDLMKAPRIPNERIKILWDEEGIHEYERLVGNSLENIRKMWGDSTSRSSISILLSSTYSSLSFAARSTNKFVDLSTTRTPKPIVNKEIRTLERAVQKANKFLKSRKSNPTPYAIESAKEKLCVAKAALRQGVRADLSNARNSRDEKLSQILTNPSSAFRSIKSSKASSLAGIQNLKVNGKVYSGQNVSDGFFDSLSSLKSPDPAALHSSKLSQDTLMDYENVLKIARDGLKIPTLSPKLATEILHTLRADVNDFYSITASHFINAGFEGLEHFHFLLNIAIDDVNLSSLEELNSVWACILYKGHMKDRESDRSYRTISTCPLIAKALDFYVGTLYSDGWADLQAETQFQGTGSSHELAALLLTEAINFSLFSAKKPVFLLLLDAKSAFDMMPKENIIVNAYKAGTCDQGLLYLNNRLGNRLTFCEWNKALMGPIHDKRGVEQGGINSDRLHKLANNNQINVAQNSMLGVNLGSSTISIIGQADDSALVANDIHSLNNLLLLTLEYCEEYSVTLVPEKTKLLAFCPPGSELLVEYAKIISPVAINGISINFSESAEHVGVVRSIHGNRPNILARLSAHRSSVFALLNTGLAKAHRANPAASMRVERLYGIPVLLSGLATMVLSPTDLSLIIGNFKQHLERLLKLHSATPECVVWFLGGCLPFEALLHLRMFSLFGMLTRLNGGDNTIANHARNMLACAKPSSKTWFLEIQKISLKYLLPHPITFINNPPTKHKFKRLVKFAVLDHWEKKLRAEASFLREASLKYFDPTFMSLSTTHPIFTTCGTSPYEVSKAVIQARWLSGRARVESLTRHWDTTNKQGICPLCSMVEPAVGTIEHFLLSGGCPALVEARLSMIAFFQAYMVPRPYLFQIFQSQWGEDDSLTMQFLLDCSVIPEVIKISQESENPVMRDIFYLTRSYVFKIYVTRRRLLGIQ